jgi:hypothetical protein
LLSADLNGIVELWDTVSRKRCKRVSLVTYMVYGIDSSHTMAVVGINLSSLDVMIWHIPGFPGSDVIICDF